MTDTQLLSPGRIDLIIGAVGTAAFAASAVVAVYTTELLAVGLWCILAMASLTNLRLVQVIKRRRQRRGAKRPTSAASS